MSEAFKRIEGGEPIKTVAEAFGKPWGSLRGKWAAAVKQAREAERMAAENDEDDAEECRLCGKTFKPTADRLDLCAKCDRDV